jgi:catechol 2,3-dioxygenase-like lactoylglutathione lyase family enzyme
MTVVLGRSTQKETLGPARRNVHIMFLTAAQAHAGTCRDLGVAMSNGIVLKSLAPVLIVDAIEPSLPFWTDGLGFTLVTTVPEAAPFDFAILARDGVEVMLQTRASAAADTGDVASGLQASALYLSVGAIDPVLAALGTADIVVPRRTTFYGADEVWVRDPAGHLVGFAAAG